MENSTMSEALKIIVILLRAIAENMNIDTAKELEALFEEWDAEDNGYED